MNRPWFLVAVIIAIEIMVIALIFPGNLTYKAIQSEYAMVGRYLGTDTQQWVNTKASTWYRSSMLDSGFLEGMRRAVTPSKEEIARSRGMEGFGKLWFDFLGNRIDAFSKVVFQFYSRGALVLLWLPYMLLLFVPAIYDGMMNWRVKRTNFSYASPVLHRYSVRGAMILLGGMAVAFLLPIAIHPIVIPAIMMGCCVLLGISMGNMQKRI